MNLSATPLLAAFIAMPLGVAAMKPTDLRCEYQTNPIAIQTSEPPRLSWIVDGEGKRNVNQSAYRILAATSPDKLKSGKADLWDSGKVASNATNGIEYTGRTLQSFDHVYWKVVLWGDNDKASKWSSTAFWRMGVLTEGDWGKAKWLGRRDAKEWRERWDLQKAKEAKTAIADMFPLKNYNYWPIWQVIDSVGNSYDAAPMLRRKFKVKRKPIEATLYICGLGYFEATINGRPVSPDVLNPAWTNYDKMPLYSTYDVTKLLLPETDNAIGVVVGRGQYNPIANDSWRLNKSSWVDQPKVIAQLRLTYADGTTETVVTDEQWHIADGPIIFDDTRIGEVYDARREQPGWDSPGFDDSRWEKPRLQNGPTVGLQSQMMPPTRRHTPYNPVRTFIKSPTQVIYDFGQNIAGWTRVTVRGDRGARVLVEYTECPTDSTIIPNLHPGRFTMTERVADPDLRLFYDATTEVRQQNGYILRGDSIQETFECHFSYKGFQYARVTTDPGVEVVAIESIPVHSDLTTVGHFQSGNDMLNRLQEISRITMLNNLNGIPTDCPHREKQGWTADAYMTTEAAIYNFDMAQFYTKWCHDIMNTQSPDGKGCTVAPSSNYDLNASIVWPAAVVYVPENLYDYYGDRRLLSTIYPSQQAFTENIRSHESKSKRGYVNEVLGDWVSPLDSILPSLKGSSITSPPEGTRYYGATTYYDIVNRMKRIAELLKRDDDKAYYQTWSDKVKTEVNQAFYRPDERAYYGEFPTTYRLAPNAVALDNGLPSDSIVGQVAATLLDHIAGEGYKMKTGFLGTRAMIRLIPEISPATAYRMVTQPHYPGWMYMIGRGTTTVWEDWNGSASLNHLPYTLVSQYFFKNLGGIHLFHDANGKANITLSPYFNADSQWVNTSYNSVYGKIVSNWRVDNGYCTWHITIPANHTATLRFPTSDLSTITESGRALSKAPGVTTTGTTISVASGSYSFRFPL